MQSEETNLLDNTAAKIVNISDFGSKKKQTEKQQETIQTVDDKFAALDERSQVAVLYYVIGYIEAAINIISSGKQARTNEVSRLFETMKKKRINKLWNGGTV